MKKTIIVNNVRYKFEYVESVQAIKLLINGVNFDTLFVQKPDKIDTAIFNQFCIKLIKHKMEQKEYFLPLHLSGYKEVYKILKEEEGIKNGITK